MMKIKRGGIANSSTKCDTMQQRKSQNNRYDKETDICVKETSFVRFIKIHIYH